MGTLVGSFRHKRLTNTGLCGKTNLQQQGALTKEPYYNGSLLAKELPDNRARLAKEAYNNRADWQKSPTTRSLFLIQKRPTTVGLFGKRALQ